MFRTLILLSIVWTGVAAGQDSATSRRKKIEAQIREDLKPGAACDQIINSEAQLGPLGTALRNRMIEGDNRQKWTSKSLFGASSCPNYSKLSEDERLKVGLRFWAILGEYVSDCRLDADLLKDRPFLRSAKWAQKLKPGGIWGTIRQADGPCSGDQTNVSNQAACALWLMNEGHPKFAQEGLLTKKPPRRLWWAEIKSEPLRKGIQQELSSFGPCRDPNSPANLNPPAERNLKGGAGR